MRRTLPLAVFAFLSPAALAQDENVLAPQFLPPNYSSEFYIDVEQALENGIFEALNGPIGGMLGERFKEVWGFRMSDLTRVRGVPVYSEKDGRVKTAQVWVLEGSKDVRIPENFEEWHKVSDLEVGGKDVVKVDSWGDPELYYQPREGFVVVGSESLIRSALEGPARSGRPDAGLMPLVTKPGVFAHAIVSLNDAMRADMPEFMAEMVSQKDPLEVMAFRFQEVAAADPEEDEPTFRIEGVFQFRDGEAGPAKFATGLRTQLEKLMGHKQFGALKPVLKAVEIKRDGEDVVVSLALGDERKAVGALQTLMIPMMMFGTTEAQAVAAPQKVVEVKKAAKEPKAPERKAPERKDQHAPERRR